MRSLVLVLALTFGAFVILPGCIQQELLATHIMAGGTVQVALDSGGMRISTGLADGKDPLGINGFSPYLTFGLIAGQDASFVSAATTLAMPNASVQLTIVPTSVTRLEVHVDGTGCAADNGVVNLRSDGAHQNLSGDFDVTGSVPGTPTPCHVSGTLSNIPVDR